MSKNLFNSVRMKRPRANRFDLTHDVKLSLDMGELVPIMVQECVPGDNFRISGDTMIRMAPMIAPVMHRIDVTMHYFFVPNRILWNEFEDWITGNIDAAPPTQPLNPATYGVYPLMDYMGLPSINDIAGRKVNALPFCAYQAIYNEYYRDQNLVPQIDYTATTGMVNAVARLLTMRRRAWKHDYFTSALPFAQKGNAVDIPIGQLSGDVPVYTNASAVLTTLDGTPDDMLVPGQNSDTIDPFRPYVDLDGVSVGPTTINDLRKAFRLQEWLEKNARGGTRYKENILAHFGVNSADSRLDRPEYICGSKAPVVISEIVNTTGEVDGLPQGNMAGHGVGVNSGRMGHYFCSEHGWIIGIMSVMPLPAYQQGVPRHFLREDRFSYFWPEFANIGEQEVLNEEIFVDHVAPYGTFGYVPRYAEYKYTPSRVCGDFKTSLNFWHLGRIFSSQPSLNRQFIECDPGKRIFAVEGSENSIYAHVLNKVTAIRLMPKYGDPMF